MNKLQDIIVIILAAGKGSRMKSNLPKVMQPLAGQPMLCQVLQTAKELHPKQKPVIVISEEMNKDKNFQAEFAAYKLVVQQEQKGTGDAVRVAMQAIEEIPDNALIAVLYGDTPLITKETINKLIEALENDNNAALGLIAADFTHLNQYARLIVDGKYVVKLVEFKEANPLEKKISLVNSGLLIVKGKFAKEFIGQIKPAKKTEEYYLTDLVKLANQHSKKVCYVKTEANEILGANTKNELAVLEHLLQERLRDQTMANGVTMIAPETVFLSSDISFGIDNVIEPHVVFGPKVKLGNRVTVRAFSHLTECEIGDDNQIGAFARIRPGTKTKAGCVIGNFVEIKNSHLAEKVKASHLSYIGDSEIDHDTNIGAGTITCNYDGVSKHKTIIGHNCFIGSNSALVAPISIGDNSLVAAGSVIVNDVGDNELAIARAHQENKAKKKNT